MKMTSEHSKLPAPYMSWGVFKSTIETLTETTVPTGPLDRRVLHELSGADYGSLISGLRFLGLIDEQRKATPNYRKLVELSKDGQKFKEFLHEILIDKYVPIIGKLNLKQGTAAELEKAFKDYGAAQGQMLTKTVRFFLKAITEAGVTPSPHMTAPKPRTPRSPARKNGEKGRTSPKMQRKDFHSDNEQEFPAGFERLPLPGMPNSFIQYPANLTEGQCQVLEGMVGVLKTSVQARTGRGGTK
jgi:hypothetical protein